APLQTGTGSGYSQRRAFRRCDSPRHNAGLPAAFPYDFLVALFHFIMPRHSNVHFVARLLALCLSPALVCAQKLRTHSIPHPQAGKQIYKAACTACHGADGRGTPKPISGFEPPRTFPDFTRCDQTTPEPNSAWKAVITHGGRSRGFSEIMPSFGEALTS